MMTTTDEAERQRVQAVLDAGLLGTPPEERFDRITRLAQESLGMPMSYLNMVDDVALVVKSPQTPGEPAPRYPYGTAFCEYTVHGDGLFEVPDALLDPRFVNTPAVTEFGVRFYAGVPLHVSDGQAVGTLCVMHPEARTLTAEERARLEALGRWAEGELNEGTLEELDRDAAAPATEPASAEGLTEESAPATAHPELHADDLVARALALPFGAVSGDIYAWAAGSGAVTVTLADVMGKGPVAGSIAEELRDALYAAERDDDDTPAEAVRRAAIQLEPRLSQLGAFVTLFHARIDTATGMVDYVDAGHGLTLHLHPDGSLDRLHSLDLPVGLQSTAEGWTAGEVHLQPGDSLVAVTDGALDLYDSTLTSLERIAAEVREQPTVGAFLDGLATRVAVSTVDDDITVLVITVD